MNNKEEINPYILDDDTRRKINHSHFTLGEGKVRELQDRHHSRIENVKKLAESLGVEYSPVLPDVDSVMKKAEIMKTYNKHKELYDTVMSQVLSVCSAQEVIEFIDDKLNSPK